jgi:hypothetical protein
MDGTLKSSVPRELDCGDGKWMELPENCAQWRAFIVAESLRSATRVLIFLHVHKLKETDSAHCCFNFIAYRTRYRGWLRAGRLRGTRSSPGWIKNFHIFISSRPALVPFQPHKTKTKLHGLSPRANYTDRATAACRRSECQLFADRGCHLVSVTGPYGRILCFPDMSRYFSIK